MRLINSGTLELKEFFGDKIPPYAILSHTWGDEEVTFQQWNARDGNLQQKSGFHKIEGACAQARHDRLEWLWVDTNCIDKTSSAELSEAINSMFAWYRDAEICYAYLEDVPPSKGPMGSIHLALSPEHQQHFRKSRWFTRGWTLQELLAPRSLAFYSRDWTYIGSKTPAGTDSHRSWYDWFPYYDITLVTGIDGRFLLDPQEIGEACAAEKMRWLSSRTTSRVEDLAYCMIGIFDINMPLLYGEGTKAFTRLQEEIIRVSDDQTIFCWKWTDAVPDTWDSILAPFPATFVNSGGYSRADRSTTDLTPYSITNIGLSMRLALFPTLGYAFAMLNVKPTTSWPGDPRVFIPIGPSKRSRGVLSRYPFPKMPILIHPGSYELDQTDAFVNCRASARTASGARSQPLADSTSHGLLLLFSAFERLYRSSPSFRHRPLSAGRMACNTTIYPARTLTDSQIIELTPVRKDGWNESSCAVMLVLSPEWEPKHVWYVFVAVNPRAEPGSDWYCAVRTRRLVGSCRREDGSYTERDGYVTDGEVFDQMAQEALSETWTWLATKAFCTDRTMYVELGDKLPEDEHPGVQLRPVFLSPWPQRLPPPNQDAENASNLEHDGPEWLRGERSEGEIPKLESEAGLDPGRSKVAVVRDRE